MEIDRNPINLPITVYYVSGVFKLNDTDAEKDYIDDSPNDKTHYNHYIHLITYDLQ